MTETDPVKSQRDNVNTQLALIKEHFIHFLEQERSKDSETFDKFKNMTVDEFLTEFNNNMGNYKAYTSMYISQMCLELGINENNIEIMKTMYWYLELFEDIVNILNK